MDKALAASVERPEDDSSQALPVQCVYRVWHEEMATVHMQVSKTEDVSNKNLSYNCTKDVPAKY